MMGLLWDVANQTGNLETGYDYDHVEDDLLIVNRQECDSIISGNKKLLTDGTDGYTPSREMRRAATIPNIILEKWHKEDGIRWWDSEDAPKLLAKLDDPEWRWLRTAPGVLSKKPFRHYTRASTA
jgi:hypothetical protein